MLQITPKSRSEIPEYDHMQRELAEEVGRINGKFGDVEWTPLRYINKLMSHAALAGFYRMSRVGLVTPLRDGMNLVANWQRKRPMIPESSSCRNLRAQPMNSKVH